MSVRKRYLASAWYPTTLDATLAELQQMGSSKGRGKAVAVIAPHAGWYFSGATALEAISALDPLAETIIIFGGHLGSASPLLMAAEDEFETVLGPLKVDSRFQSFIADNYHWEKDLAPDNTVEIQLPLVKHLFPAAKIVWLRLPAQLTAWECGRDLAQFAQTAGIRTVAIGSTDLTHYGPDYGFFPHGSGQLAERWVEDINDKRFIEALITNSPAEALRRATEENSACSAGAAVAALGFAEANGAKDGRLLAYTLSSRILKRASFVGYAAIAWTV